MVKRFIVLSAVCMVAMGAGLFGGCKPEVTGDPLDNIPPSVRLPNSMADSMNLSATTLVKWIGDDADGIVVGYSYRVDGGQWRHEADHDGDWTPADDLNGNDRPDRNWDGGFGLLGVDDDGDNEISAYEDSSRYYGYSIYADEELPNGIDDDGDGRVDEDCWGNDANRDGDCGYDPEDSIDEDMADGVDNDQDGLLDEDLVVRPRWVRAMGVAGEWTFWSSATQDTVRFNATGGAAGEAHQFEVKCLDDQKEESAPLILTIFTTTYLPTPEITGGPSDSANVFMSADTLGAWKGVRYDLGGTDIHRDVYYNTIEDGRVVRWAYWLDDPGYRPSRDRFDALPEAVLFDVTTGWHTLYLQCMDNAGAISDSVVSRSFYASNPTFEHDILLVDATYRGFPGAWNEETIYEGTLLAGKDVTRITVPPDAPQSFTLRPADLAPFKALYWYKAGSEQDSLLQLQRALVSEYVLLGGKVVFDGLRVLSGSFTNLIPSEFQEGDFAHDWIGLASADEPAGYVFQGATPLAAGYPVVHLKAGAFPYPGLPFTTTATARQGADPLFAITSTDSTANGRVNAIRYVPQGSTGKVLFFGFPLMYLEPAELVPLGQAILTDLGL
ncbi:MAG: hypothetical protein MUE60_01655 [Candidatus Eisenbacteria bacterium]|jgi:hypothetical protein|nr:hypothetical protein [Candidatus Eisenbacteria bacterium]